MKVLQINTIVNSGSTGRIAEDIGRVLIEKGHESYIAYGRGNRPSQSKLIKIGTKLDIYLHGIKTLFLDQHGFGSKKATKKLITEIERIKPDIICLNNLHGYYINIEVLFKYISKSNTPVLYILFDCWAFTGHCTYFEDIHCDKWKTNCEKCPKIDKYPKSWVDNSSKNYEFKKSALVSLKNIEFLVHSQWLAGLVKNSFLKRHKIHTYLPGIDLEKFWFKGSNNQLRIKNQFKNKSVILGVASIWDKRKGLDDFLSLNTILNDQEFQIILIGMSKSQIKALPSNIIGIERTENIQELADYYAVADAFVNPTWQDNFPTTNIEALACGTPVITYNTGGSPESIDDTTGIVVNKGDIDGLKNAIEKIKFNGKNFYQENCRRRAEQLFDKNKNYTAYLALFQKIINEQKEG